MFGMATTSRTSYNVTDCTKPYVKAHSVRAKQPFRPTQFSILQQSARIVVLMVLVVI